MLPRICKPCGIVKRRGKAAKFPDQRQLQNAYVHVDSLVCKFVSLSCGLLHRSGSLFLSTSRRAQEIKKTFPGEGRAALPLAKRRRFRIKPKPFRQAVLLRKAALPLFQHPVPSWRAFCLSKSIAMRPEKSNPPATSFCRKNICPVQFRPEFPKSAGKLWRKPGSAKRSNQNSRRGGKRTFPSAQAVERFLAA